MQIKYLADQGLQKSRIAEQLGISRQTVYNHLNRTEPFPKSRGARPSKLDPYKEYVRARLEDFDLPAPTLLRELKSRGYDGGLTILRQFVRPLKAEWIRRVTERFETLPGRQAQIDWGECGMLMEDGQRKKLYVFVMVLGYSRMTYARFTTSSKLPVLLRCLDGAFRALGLPSELLVDNMKQAVEKHDVTTGTVHWNSRFLDFVEHHEILPVASPPYWPRVKGKVERGVGYVKQSFLEGRTFTDLEDLNRQLELWLDTVANVRVHGTTGERPVDRHQQELRHLRPSAAVPVYDTRPVELRHVPNDCHIAYRAVRYSVDPEAVGRTVTVRADGERVGDPFSVYLGEAVVARHRIHPKGTGRVMLPEHLKRIRALTRGPELNRHQNHGTQPNFRQADRPLDRRVSTQAWPSVQVRSLKLYEELTGGVR